jgi:hypothetical protein
MEIKAGRIEIVAGVSSVDANGVQLNDGTVLWPDAVIAATGFSTGLESLVGHLGVLDDEGYEKGVGVIGPRAHRATRIVPAWRRRSVRRRRWGR